MICSAQAHSRCPTLATVHKTLKDSAYVPAVLEAPVLNRCIGNPFFEVYRLHFEKYMSANALDRNKIS